MDEMTMIRRLRPDEPMPTASTIDDARTRLLAEAATPTQAGSNSLMRRGWVIAGSIVAAASVAIVPVVTSRPASTASAATVLRQAAAAIRALPDITPRPTQFFYVDDRDGESWYSIDGTHDGYLIRQGHGIALPGCRNGRQIAMKGTRPAGTTTCTPRPAYLPDLPTTTAGMTAWVEAQAAGGSNGLAKQIDALLTNDYLSPASRAALFSVAATLPGATVVAHTADGAGRPGIGIRWLEGGGSATMVFDTNSHELLGLYTVSGSGIRGDEVLYSTGIVNRILERP